jgi:hypothetical protein
LHLQHGIKNNCSGVINPENTPRSRQLILRQSWGQKTRSDTP